MLGRPSTALIDVIQHDPRQQIPRVLQVGALHGQRPQLLGESVPAEERPIVDIDDLQGTQVFEGMEGDSSIKGELFVSADQAGTAVWG